MVRPNDGLANIEPERVCIIKPSSMGDVIHAMPILSALRRRWPSAHLSWIVNRPFAELLDGHPDLDERIVYDRGRKGLDGRKFGGMAVLLGRLARDRFDLTIDLQGLLRSALMVAATRARVRVGMADAREGARWFYTHRVDAPRLGMHAVDRALRVASRFGADDSEPLFHLPISDQARRWAAEAVAGLPRPRIILNVGAQWRTKRWPPEHFARSDGWRWSNSGRASSPSVRTEIARWWTTSPAASRRSRCSTCAGARGCKSSPPSAGNRTWCSPTTPDRSTWPRRPGRGSSASTPAPAPS